MQQNQRFGPQHIKLDLLTCLQPQLRRWRQEDQRLKISLVYSKFEASLNYRRGALKKQNSQEMHLWREVASVS